MALPQNRRAQQTTFCAPHAHEFGTSRSGGALASACCGLEIACIQRVNTDLFVFELRFEGRPSVERAFGLVGDDPNVASCLVEPESLRIRVVTSKASGVPLVERIYERGGLVWCKLYPLDSGHTHESPTTSAS